MIVQNNWIGAYTAPSVADSLSASSTESDAMLIGRVVADVVTVGIGVTEISAGVGITGGGAIAACVGTACVGAVATTVAGAAVAGYGAVTVYEGAAGLGDNLGRLFSKRTSHAQQRASEGRPVGSGWGDAQKAGRSSVYYDTETGAYVVTGKNGRAHFFITKDGQLKLNSSIRLPGNNVADRISSGKWTHLTYDEYLEWLEALNNTLAK